MKYVASIMLATATLAVATSAGAEGAPVEEAKMLSAFGERAAFSPDGSRIAFVGKSYADAYEIELATGHVRNLTGGVPHQGILRVQYLANGDYLLSGPRRNIGPNSRLSVDLFVLRKDLKTGLEPLGQSVFEGVAIGPNNLVAWQQIPAGEKLREGESWMDAVGRIAFEHYVGRLEWHGGRPVITGKRRILQNRPADCTFAEVQDFRSGGNEIVFYCGGSGILGYDLRTSRYNPYVAPQPSSSRYMEVEGVSPDGSWAAVECGERRNPAERVPPLDICRLELVPGGRFSKLVIATAPGSTRTVSNPVVSPDGKWLAFQQADQAIGEPGEGGGIYLLLLDQ